MDTQNMAVEIESLRAALRKADAGLAEMALHRAAKLAELAYEAEFARSDDHEQAQRIYVKTERNVLDEELCSLPETVTVTVGTSDTTTPAWQAWRDRFEFDAAEALSDAGLDTTIVIQVVGDADPARYATIHSAKSTHALLRVPGWEQALQEIADTVSDEVEEEFA